MKRMFALIVMASLFVGCGKGRAGSLSTDFTGTWDLTYEDAIEVRVRGVGEGELVTRVAESGGRVTLADGGVDFLIDCSRVDVTCPSEVWPRELTLEPRGADDHLGPVTHGAEQVDVQGAQLTRRIHGRGDGSCALRPGSIVTAEVMSIASAKAVRPEAVALTSGWISTVLGQDCIAASGGLPVGAEVTLATGFSAVKR